MPKLIKSKIYLLMISVKFYRNNIMIIMTVLIIILNKLLKNGVVINVMSIFKIYRLFNLNKLYNYAKF